MGPCNLEISFDHRTNWEVIENGWSLRGWIKLRLVKCVLVRKFHTNKLSISDIGRWWFGRDQSSPTVKFQVCRRSLLFKISLLNALVKTHINISWRSRKRYKLKHNSSLQMVKLACFRDRTNRIRFDIQFLSLFIIVFCLCMLKAASFSVFVHRHLKFRVYQQQIWNWKQ